MFEPRLWLWLCCQHVLIHVRDISHPDAIAQKSNVVETLNRQNVDPSLIDNMIEVCNKVDKLSKRFTYLLNYLHRLEISARLVMLVVCIVLHFDTLRISWINLSERGRRTA